MTSVEKVFDLQFKESNSDYLRRKEGRSENNSTLKLVGNKWKLKKK